MENKPCNVSLIFLNSTNREPKHPSLHKIAHPTKSITNWKETINFLSTTPKKLDPKQIWTTISPINTCKASRTARLTKEKQENIKQKDNDYFNDSYTHFIHLGHPHRPAPHRRPRLPEPPRVSISASGPPYGARASRLFASSGSQSTPN